MRAGALCERRSNAPSDYHDEMGITVDLRAASSADVTVVLSPLAELMASLHVLTEIDHHPEAVRFLHAVEGLLDSDDRAQIQRFSPLWTRLRCRLLFPVAVDAAPSLQEELDRLAGLPMETFLRLAAQGALGISDDPDASALGEPGRAAAFLQHCRRRSQHRLELAKSLLEDPEAFRRSLIAFLARCDEAFFSEHWKSVLPALLRSATAVRKELERASLSEALQSLSPTASVLDDGERVRFDKLQVGSFSVREQRLLVVPSVRAWPHLTIKHDPGLPPVILYNVQANENPDPLSVRQLASRLAALTSPLRLEVCRHLLGEPITTSELAVRLGMSEPQVSRTLRQLRESGLVISERDGRFLRHRLATGVVKRLGPDILATITR